MDYSNSNNHIQILNPFVLWFTGLPSSGKTTLAESLRREFLLYGSKTLTVFDGDAVRKDFSKDLSFSKEDRHTNNLRVAEKVLNIVRGGDPVCVALISPYRETRGKIREMIPGFIEVYIKCPLELCEKRDTKGMFKLARERKIKNFTGIDDPYEEPSNPGITVETDRQGVKNCVDTILNELEVLGHIRRLRRPAMKEKALE
jgi:adenylylsulfate kinase